MGTVVLTTIVPWNSSVPGTVEGGSNHHQPRPGTWIVEKAISGPIHSLHLPSQCLGQGGQGLEWEF
jgi:hypothetical protein